MHMKYIYRMGSNTTGISFKPLGKSESVEPGNHEKYLMFYIYHSLLHAEENVLWVFFLFYFFDISKGIQLLWWTFQRLHPFI